MVSFMRISGEGKFGILIGLVSMAGAGLIMLAPDRPWIGWGLVAIALVGAIVLLFHHLYESLGRRRALAAMLMIFGGITFFAGAIWYGLETEKKVGSGHEAITTPTTYINFPYVRALFNDDKAAKERHLFVENAKSVPMQGVEIVFQDVRDPLIRHLFKVPILYQDGGWFVPIGEPHTLRIGAGQYVASINSLDGSFTEYLSLRMDGGT